MSRLASVVAALALGAIACSTPPTDARIGVAAPPESEFPPLADLLDHSCGTLDCHGNAQRNLVMWGCYGLRLDTDGTTNVPGCRATGGVNTTPDEYTASYRSLVGLEPALMTDVVANHGDPNELTFVRKAFGLEAHKGGQIFQLGTDADTCVLSWLASNTNTTACTNALASAP